MHALFGIGGGHLLLAIISGIIAATKNRNIVSWIFLTFFWGIISLIVLICCRSLAMGESDSASKFLWTLVFLPIILLILLIVFAGAVII